MLLECALRQVLRKTYFQFKAELNVFFMFIGFSFFAKFAALAFRIKPSFTKSNQAKNTFFF